MKSFALRKSDIAVCLKPPRTGYSRNNRLPISRCTPISWAIPQTTGAESAEVKKLNAGVMADDDPGPKYAIGAWYSFCGEPDLAYPALQQAIAQNYCAYPEMETDPLLAKVRATPKFAEIRSSGIVCQQHFLEHREQSDSK